MKKDLAQVFHDKFRVVVGDQPEVRRASYALRYQVYCLETGFEDKARFPDGLEYDEFDERSTHALVFYRGVKEPAATVRLILPDPEEPSRPFPIEQHCLDSMRAGGFNPGVLPRQRLAEISRFAVSKRFKRRLGEKGTLAGNMGCGADALSSDMPSRRLLPHLTLGLFRAIVTMSASEGMTHWYAVMEPALLRLLTRFGIHFRPVGRLVDYHGKRQPCMGEVDEVLAGIWRQRRDVWNLITDGGRIWPEPERRRFGNYG